MAYLNFVIPLALYPVVILLGAMVICGNDHGPVVFAEQSLPEQLGRERRIIRLFKGGSQQGKYNEKLFQKDSDEIKKRDTQEKETNFHEKDQQLVNQDKSWLQPPTNNWRHESLQNNQNSIPLSDKKQIQDRSFQHQNHKTNVENEILSPSQKLKQEIRIQQFEKILADETRHQYATQNVKIDKIPDAVLAELQEEDTPSQFYAKDKQMILYGEDMYRDNRYFKFLVREDMADVVELWLHVRRNYRGVRSQPIFVNSVKPSSGAFKRTPIKHSNRLEVGRWIVLTMSSKYIEPMSDGSIVLEIYCPRCNARELKTKNHKPLLVFDINPVRIIRKREIDVSTQDDCDTDVACCLKPLTVNVTSLGQDNLIPDTFSINYCYGNCSVSLTQFSGLHTSFVQNHEASFGSPRGLRICCVPIQYQDIPVFIGPDTVYLNKVRAISCGCVY